MSWWIWLLIGAIVGFVGGILSIMLRIGTLFKSSKHPKGDE